MKLKVLAIWGGGGGGGGTEIRNFGLGMCHWHLRTLSLYHS